MRWMEINGHQQMIQSDNVHDNATTQQKKMKTEMSFSICIYFSRFGSNIYTYLHLL